jgi:hypothetical protein
MQAFSRRGFALTGLMGALAGLVGRGSADAAPVAHSRSSEPRRNFRLSPEEVAHRLEIDDLLTRYTIAVDDEQFDLLDTVFTPDAIIDYTSGGGIRGSYPEVKAWLTRGLSTGNPARMHMIGGNKQVTIDGAGATVRAYFFNPYAKDLPGGGLDYSLGGGFYNHKLVLTPEGWRSMELYEKRVWRQGYPARPNPTNARSTEVWESGGPARPKDAKP